MTKVYGTNAYDFKHHHVAEYPVEPSASVAQLVAEKLVESKPGAALSSTITLSEIQRDRLTKIVVDNWSKANRAGEKPEKAFDLELVKDIYEMELLVKGGRKTEPLQRVMILEVSQYLENYLWPNFDPKIALFEHDLSNFDVKS